MLELTPLEFLNVSSLVKGRIGELERMKESGKVDAAICDESLAMYRPLIAKLNAEIEARFSA